MRDLRNVTKKHDNMRCSDYNCSANARFRMRQQTRIRLPLIQRTNALSGKLGRLGVKIIKATVAGLVWSGLFAVQASAQTGLFAGMSKAGPTTAITKTQFKLPFGMSAKKVRRILGRDGYSEIEITYIGVINAKADACREGIRYRVKVRANGSYEYRNKIGECRTPIRAADVREVIRKEGFRRINIENDGKLPYVASACRRGNRYDIQVSQFGDVKVGRRTGKCRARDDFAERLRANLRRDGYDRIKFVQSNRRNYIIEACLRGRRMRLDIQKNRNGSINDRSGIGRCSTRINTRDIGGILRKAGFDRIDIVDDTPPRYRIEACRRNTRLRIAMNQWGERLNEKRIGECEPPATVASLTDDLRKNVRKFKNINVRRGRRYPFVANVCDSGVRREIYFSQYGNFEGKKDVGRCVSPRMSAILDKLRDRGFRDAEVFVEACRRSGRRVRVKFDEYGNEVSRERIGRCG